MNNNIQKTAMTVSFIVAVVMLLGKVTAYFITGSIAILSDAAESILHIVATVIAGICLWYISLPADKKYPYGYGKLSYFSAGLEGGLILSASITIVYSSIKALIIGSDLHKLDIGLAIIFVMGLINLVLGVFLLRVGKAHQSLVLIAHARHVFTDMWTSLGVVIGVAITWWTEILWLDPLIALVIGFHILHTAVFLLKQAFEGLMEKASLQNTQLLMACLEKAVEDGLITGFHQLHYRCINNEMLIDVHFLFPNDFSLTMAHSNTTKIEEVICNTFSNYTVVITTHLEPEDHQKAHPQGHSYHDPMNESY